MRGRISHSSALAASIRRTWPRLCCLNGYKTYYLKATELRDKLKHAVDSSYTSRQMGTLVKSSCLIVDEGGRCAFDHACTNLFLDAINRRYEKDGADMMILTINIPANNWDEFFTEDNTLLCALDRLFDRATVFMMKGRASGELSWRPSRWRWFHLRSR